MREIVNIFCERYVKANNTLIILIIGFYAIGTQKKNSDLGIYIIEDKNDKRKRGNTWMNGLEVEYFINPLSQVYCYLDTKPTIRPVTATMINNGIVYFQKEDELSVTVINKLLERCDLIVNSELSILSKTEIE